MNYNIINDMVKIAGSHTDLKKVAQCRIKAFPQSLSSKLGIKYVIKMLNNYVNDHNFLLYIEENKKCIGFITGLAGSAKYNCSTRMTVDVTSRQLIFGIIKKPWLLFHPMVLNNWAIGWEVFKNKFRTREALEKGKLINPPKLSPEVIDSVGLIDIAVAPEYQGKGYGSLLLEAFENHCIKIGEHRMHLSVNPANNKAIKSYKKNGWKMFKAELNQLNFYKEI